MPPPLPPGFEPEASQRSLPPLPPGFEHEMQARSDNHYTEEKEPRDVKNPNMAWIDIPGLGRAAKGAAKTVTGLGVGAGQVLSDLDATGALSRAGQSKPAQAVKRWAMSPATSIAEEIGGALPYFSPMGLESVAAKAGTLGFLTPTESGDMQSHLIDAAASAAGGGALSKAGAVIPHIPHWWHWFPGVGTLAWSAAQMARQGLNAGPVRAVRGVIAREAPAEA